MEEKQIEKKLNDWYNNKLENNFFTRLNIFLFKLIIENNLSDDYILKNNQIDDFINFELKNNQDWVEYYATEYYQQMNNTVLLENFYSINNKNKLTPNQIYKKLNDAKINNFYSVEIIDGIDSIFKKYKKWFNNKYPSSSYKELIIKSQDSISHCAYCNITLNEIIGIANQNNIRNKRSNRGYTFEIDRKEPNYEYTPDNLVLSCYWCNNAKTDEFSYNEFKEIGKKIKEVWDNRKVKKHLLTGS